MNWRFIKSPLLYMMMVMVMTEKTYTSKEINKKLNKYFLQYMDVFNANRMSFAEITLIKSTIVDLQVLFDGNGDVDD